MRHNVLRIWKVAVFRATFVSPVSVFATRYKTLATHRPSYFLYALLWAVVCPDRPSRVQDNKVL